ncbi:MAG: PTS sugar transporter subunit IIA [Treponema sp.]|nr:PTS sugar transporter subunit IIA [Treponema sp.]
MEENTELQADIVELIHRGGVFQDVEGSTPEEIYSNFVKMLDLPDGMTADFVYNALCTREKVLSTAVGNGIALPHARAPIMRQEKDQRICVVYLKQPIEMHAPDERLVSTMFVLLTHNPQIHLKVLTELAGLFRSARFRKALEEKAPEAEILSLIRELDV